MKIEKNAEKIMGGGVEVAPPEEIARRIETRVTRVEEETTGSAIDNQRRIEGIEKDSGLPLSEIVAARKETVIFERIDDVRLGTRSLIDIKLRGEVDEFLEQIMPQQPHSLTDESSAAAEHKKLGAIFYPESGVKRILRAPKEERAELLREFKEKLAEQKEALSQMQAELIRRIRENPDAPLSELFEYVEITGAEYGLTYEQKEEMRALLRAYKNKRDFVKNTRERYPDDKELFRVLFGKDPQGKIKIIEGPMTLYVRCWDIGDFAFIYSSASTLGFTSKEKMGSMGVAGLSGLNVILPGLNGVVMAENSSIGKEENSPKIMAHEEQHAFKGLFMDKIRGLRALKRVGLANTVEEAEQRIRTYLRGRRENSVDNAMKNEVLAYFKEKRFDPEKIYEVLTRTKEENDLYTDQLEREKKECSSMFQSLSIKFGEGLRTIRGRLVNEVYGDEYMTLLKKCVDIPFALEKAGYSDDEVIALLTQEPLQRWEKATKRLLEMRRKKSRLEKAAGGEN